MKGYSGQMTKTNRNGFLVLFDPVFAVGLCGSMAAASVHQTRRRPWRAAGGCWRTMAGRLKWFVARSPGVKAGDETGGVCAGILRELHPRGNGLHRLRLPTGGFPIGLKSGVMNTPGFGKKSDGPAQLRLLPPDALATYDQLQKSCWQQTDFCSRPKSGDDGGIICCLQKTGRRNHAAKAHHPFSGSSCGNWGWWNLWIAGGHHRTGSAERTELSVHRTASEGASHLLSSPANDHLVLPLYQYEVMNAYAGREALPAAGQVGSQHPPSSRQIACDCRKEMDWLWSHEPRTK